MGQMGIDLERAAPARTTLTRSVEMLIAADHQDHEDGLASEAASRAGVGAGGVAPTRSRFTSALDSLKRRVDIFDEETFNLRHPLFATRP